MKVLLQTRFYPNIGGIETLAEILAREWTEAGLQVTVSTDVPSVPGPQKGFPFPVHHAPGVLAQLRLARQADVLVQMNVSLRATWPLAFTRARFIAAHHGCYYVSRKKRRDWKEQLKLMLARHASANIACSHYVAGATGIPCDVIPNAYNDKLFTGGGQADARPNELAFVGRLVSDKGADRVLSALALLPPALKPRLTVIGDGPERPALERQTGDLGLERQVTFVGGCDQAAVAQLLRKHQILVVPSLWEEPFGIVALEGAGCGCGVLGSDTGGLPEAIGPAGATFRSGDARDLARKIQEILQDQDRLAHFRASAPPHLKRHSPSCVANQYLQVFRRVLSQ